MSRKQLDLTKKEKFLFKFKLQKQLKQKFNGEYQIQVNNEAIQLFSRDSNMLKKMETFLDRRFQQLQFEFLQFNVNTAQLDQSDEYIQLKDQIQHQIIYKNAFLKAIERNLEQNFPQAYNYFKQKIKSNLNITVLLVDGKGITKIKDFLQNFYRKQNKFNKNSYFQQKFERKPKNNGPNIQIDLQLSNEKIFFASLLNLFDNLDYTNFIIYDKNDKLFIKGVQEQVKSYKKTIKNVLKQHKLIIIEEKYIDDIEDLKQIAKKQWELKIISFKDAQKQCRKIYTKFNLDQPLYILKQLKEEKSQFNTFIFKRKYEIQVRNAIIKISNHQKIDQLNKQQKNIEKKEKYITQQWKIQVIDILIPHLKMKNVSQLIQKTLQKQILKLNLEDLLKQRIQRLNKKDSIIYKLTFDSEKQKQIYTKKNNFCNILKNNIQSAQLMINFSLEQLLKIKGVMNQFTLIEHQDQIYLFAVTAQFGQKYSGLIALLQKAKVKKQIKIENSVYYLMKDEIKKIIDEEKTMKIQLKQKKQQCILILNGYEYNVDNIKNIIQMNIKRIQSNINHDYIMINKAEQQLLKDKDIIDKYKKQFEVDIKMKEIKDPGVEIRLQNNNLIKITKLTLNDASSKIKVITNSQYLEQIKQIEWSHFKSQIKKNKKHENYDKDRNIYYINEDKFKIKQILQKIFQKKYPIAMQLIKNKPDEFLLKLYEFMSKKPQLQTITLCCHNQKQIKFIQNIIKQLKTNKSFNFLLKQESVWCAIQKNQFLPYSQKINQKINSEYKSGRAQFYLNQQDLQLKQITHTFYKQQMILQQNSTNVQTAVKINNGKYTYVVDNIHSQLSNYHVNKIQNTRSNQIQLTISLIKIKIQNKTGDEIDIFSKISRKIINQKKNKTKQYVTKVNVVGLDNIYKLEFSTDKSKMKQINTIKYRIKQYLKNGKIKEKIKLDLKYITLKRFEKLCESKYITLQNQDLEFIDKSQKIIQIPIYGYSDKYIQDFKVQYEIIKKEFENIIPFPSQYWIKTNKQIQIFRIQQHQKQFKQIQNQFKFAQIKNLKRIQNNFLWKQYYNQKKALQWISKSNIKQMRLFHGTKQLDPSVIFLDKQEAFNINYSSQDNVFGRGIYFAKQAKYSNDYANHTMYHRSMLFCRVLVGESKHYSIDQRNNKILDTPFRDLQRKIRYESISSNFAGTDIYVVYKNRRAYPQYLIEY